MFLWSDVTPQAAWLYRAVVRKIVVEEIEPSHKTLLEMLKNIHILKPRTSVACKQLSYNVIEEHGIKLSGTPFSGKPEGCIH